MSVPPAVYNGVINDVIMLRIVLYLYRYVSK